MAFSFLTACGRMKQIVLCALILTVGDGLTFYYAFQCGWE